MPMYSQINSSIDLCGFKILIPLNLAYLGRLQHTLRNIPGKSFAKLGTACPGQGASTTEAPCPGNHWVFAHMFLRNGKK